MGYPICKRDGRHSRADRSRLAVADALLELLDQGDTDLSAPRIAARAGVSRRTVLNHFPERRALFEAAVLRRYEYLLATMKEVPDDLVLEKRIDRFVSERARTLELLAPLQRSASRFEWGPPATFDRLGAMDAALASEVGHVFAAELSARPVGERHAIRFALVAASSWTAWESYRVHQDLGARQARSALRAAIAALLRQ